MPWAASTSIRRKSSRLSRWKRSEEHTSELQSRLHLVCRLLLEKKKHNPPARTRLCPSSGPQDSSSATLRDPHPLDLTSRLAWCRTLYLDSHANRTALHDSATPS